MTQPSFDFSPSARPSVRRAIVGIRISAVLPATAVLLLLSGCGHTVRFADLRQIVQVGDVGALRHAAHHGQANGAPRGGDYLVGPADLIELRAVDGSPVKLVSEACTQPCTGCPAGDYIDPDIYLAESGRRVRVSAFALSSVSALRVAQKPECIGPVLGRPWSQLQERLAALGWVPSLLPQAPRWAMPGDIVKVAVEYRFGLRQGAAPEPYTFAETDTAVDGGGRAYVPAFSTVSPEPDTVSSPPGGFARAATSPAATAATETVAAAMRPDISGLQLVVEQQAQSAARHMSFWLPGRPLAEQPTLDELERCLKAMSSTEALNPTFSRCAQFGIDPYRYQPVAAHNRQVSYRFAVEHKVTFVFWDGRRHASTFLPGQTVAEAARSIHRGVIGRDVSAHDHLFAAVDPHSAIRAGGERPFYARLEAAPGAVLDHVLLLPGDVVYLSRWEPQRPL